MFLSDRNLREDGSRGEVSNVNYTTARSLSVAGASVDNGGKARERSDAGGRGGDRGWRRSRGLGRPGAHFSSVQFSQCEHCERSSGSDRSRRSACS